MSRSRLLEAASKKNLEVFDGLLPDFYIRVQMKRLERMQTFFINRLAHKVMSPPTIVTGVHGRLSLRSRKTAFPAAPLSARG